MSSWIAPILASLLVVCMAIAPVESAPIPGENPAAPTARDFVHWGSSAVGRGDAELALAAFTRAIELDSHLAPAYSNRCLLHLQRSRYREARQDCSRALQLSPHNCEAYLNRGLAAYYQGDYAAALADYDRALQLQPGDPRARYNRALIAFDRGNYLAAMTDYNRAIAQSSPGDRRSLATLYNERGLTAAQLGNSPQAIADFSLAIRLNPDNARTYYNRAVTQQQHQQYRAAIADFSRTLERQPNFASAYINRGLAREHLGQRRAALQDLQHAHQHYRQQGEHATAERVQTLILQLRKHPHPHIVAIVNPKNSVFV